MNLNIDCNYTSVYSSSYIYKDKLALYLSLGTLLNSKQDMPKKLMDYFHTPFLMPVLVMYRFYLPQLKDILIRRLSTTYPWKITER